MIVCPNCSSKTFDDMSFCYVCMQVISTPKMLEQQAQSKLEQESEDEELVVDEPLEPTNTIALARFRVAMAGLFVYDMYMQKREGQQLSVGCSIDNNIVLPHTASRRHPLRIYYSNEQLWAEEKKCKQKVKLNGVVLTGAKSLQSGATIKIGKATIELIEG